MASLSGPISQGVNASFDNTNLPLIRLVAATRNCWSGAYQNVKQGTLTAWRLGGLRDGRPEQLQMPR